MQTLFAITWFTQVTLSQTQAKFNMVLIWWSPTKLTWKHYLLLLPECIFISLGIRCTCIPLQIDIYGDYCISFLTLQPGPSRLIVDTKIATLTVMDSYILVAIDLSAFLAAMACLADFNGLLALAWIGLFGFNDWLSASALLGFNGGFSRLANWFQFVNHIYMYFICWVCWMVNWMDGTA